MMDVGVSLQHIEKHGSSANKRFNISDIFPITEILWQVCIQLF